MTAKDRLSSLTEPGRHLVKRAALFGIGERLLWFAQIGIIALTVSGLAQPKPAFPSIGLIVAFAGLALVRVHFQSVAGRNAFEAGAEVKTGLRAQLVKRLSDWSPLDGRRPGSGAAAVLGSDHVEAIAPFLSRFEPARIKMSVLPVIVFFLVLTVSWAAALVLLVTGPLVPLFMSLIGIAAKKASDRQMAALLGIHAYLADRLQGLQDLRILGAEKRAGAQLEDYARGLKKATMKVLGVAFLTSTVLELFASLGVAMVAVFVGFHLLGHLNFGVWQGQLGLGPALFILMLAPEFFAPLRDYSAAYHDRASALAAADALYPVLHGERLEMTDGAAMRPPGEDDVILQLKGVSFSYPDTTHPALEGVDVTIRQGEHVALSGVSGAGKSTLLAILAGIAAPDMGKRYVASRANAGAKMTWIAQSPHFLRTSLGRNLTLGRPGFGQPALERAVAQSGAGAVVARLPRGFHTLLGERAQGLSGGEAQRMALARAYLADADIVFADEPTAHLDRETAREVLDSLMQLAAGKTLVVATHDPEVEARMDRVIAVEAFAERREAAQ